MFRVWFHDHTSVIDDKPIAVGYYRTNTEHRKKMSGNCQWRPPWGPFWGFLGARHRLAGLQGSYKGAIFEAMSSPVDQRSTRPKGQGRSQKPEARRPQAKGEDRRGNLDLRQGKAQGISHALGLKARRIYVITGGAGLIIKYRRYIGDI